MQTAKRIKFLLNGCDISFAAEAPADMTLEQLLFQCDRIKPDFCACGIRSADPTYESEIVFDYNDVHKADETAPCQILPKKIRR